MSIRSSLSPILPEAAVRITLLQFAPVFEDRAASRDRVGTLLAEVESDWILLPEMALSGFTMNVAAASWDGMDEAFVASLARGKKAYVTIGGVKDGRNCAFTYGRDGRLLSVYEKRHLFSPSAEGESYSAGETTSILSLAEKEGEKDAGELRVGPSICYDLRFPYHFWNLAPQVEAFFAIASWPASRREHWKTLLAARAIENQAFVIGVNRTGSSPDTDYSGDSAIIDPRGRSILECGSAEGAFSADIDPESARAWRRSFGAMADRLE